MTTSAPSIVQERVFEASIDEVFRAWSDPEELSLWMRPDPAMKPATVEVDFRVGGRFTIAMHGERDFLHEGEYLEIDAPKRLVMTWVSHFVEPAYRHTRVSVELEALGPTETRCRLVHDRLPALAPGQEDPYEGHPGGWESILGHAAERFAGRTSLA